MDRRGFLGTGLLASAALLLVSGCATPKEYKKVDIKVWDEEAKKWRYNEVYDTQTKTWKYFTLPCGSAIPSGAICTCNCVPAAAPRPDPIQTCTCNKVCTCVPVYQSDVNSKTNFATVDTQEVLDKLVTLPIRTWNYREDGESVRHIGPMAQDFTSIFGVGADDLHISAVDADGVALAAIQALHKQIGKRDAEISAQNKRIAELGAKLETIEQSLK